MKVPSVSDAVTLDGKVFQARGAAQNLDEMLRVDRMSGHGRND